MAKIDKKNFVHIIDAWHVAKFFVGGGRGSEWLTNMNEKNEKIKKSYGIYKVQFNNSYK